MHSDTSSRGAVALKHMHNFFDISSIKRWSQTLLPFTMGWFCWPNRSQQKRCCQATEDVKRWCSFCLAVTLVTIETCPFGTVSHPIIKLATLKPPCWRDQMEKTHRDRDMPVEPQYFLFPGIQVLDHSNMGTRKLLRWLQPQTPSDYNYNRNVLKY